MVTLQQIRDYINNARAEYSNNMNYLYHLQDIDLFLDEVEAHYDEE